MPLIGDEGAATKRSCKIDAEEGDWGIATLRVGGQFGAAEIKPTFQK